MAGGAERVAQAIEQVLQRGEKAVTLRVDLGEGKGALDGRMKQPVVIVDDNAGPDGVKRATIVGTMPPGGEGFMPD